MLPCANQPSLDLDENSWLLWHCVNAVMMGKPMYQVDFTMHFSVILFLTSKFDFHDVLTEMPSNLNATFGWKQRK